MAGLKKSSVPLISMSAIDCRASENLDDFQCKLTFSPYTPIFFVIRASALFKIFQGLSGILQRNYWKMTMEWSFSYNFFVKLSLYNIIHLTRIKKLYLHFIFQVGKSFHR